MRMIREVKSSLPELPVIVSGYTDHDNVTRLLREADGAIVGSAFEKGGRGGAVQVQAVRDYVQIVSGM